MQSWPYAKAAYGCRCCSQRSYLLPTLGPDIPVCYSVTQLKERYTSMRPYGEWLAQETVTMQDLIDSVPPEQRVPPPVLPAGVATPHTNGASNGASAGLVSSLSGSWP